MRTLWPNSMAAQQGTVPLCVCVCVLNSLFINMKSYLKRLLLSIVYVSAARHPHLIGFSRLWKHNITFLWFFLSSFVCATAHFSLQNGLLLPLPLAIRNTPSHKHSIVSIGVANIILTACWYKARMPATLWQFRFEYMCDANISYIYAYWNIVTSCWAHVCICIANCLINPINFLLLNLWMAINSFCSHFNTMMFMSHDGYAQTNEPTK